MASKKIDRWSKDLDVQGLFRSSHAGKVRNYIAPDLQKIAERKLRARLEPLWLVYWCGQALLQLQNAGVPPTDPVARSLVKEIKALSKTRPRLIGFLEGLSSEDGRAPLLSSFMTVFKFVRLRVNENKPVTQERRFGEALSTYFELLMTELGYPVAPRSGNPSIGLTGFTRRASPTEKFTELIEEAPEKAKQLAKDAEEVSAEIAEELAEAAASGIRNPERKLLGGQWVVKGKGPQVMFEGEIYGSERDFLLR